MIQHDEEEKRGWRFKKEIAVGDLVAFATACIAIIVAYSTLDRRLAVIESATITQHERDSRQDAESLRYQQRIDEALRDMNRKLDRLIERKS